jgi:MFS family permease
MRASERPDAPRRVRLQRNLPLLCAYRGLQMTMFPIAIVPLYWRDELGLGMTEIFLVQALFGLFVACLEFPGGYLSDRIGYRPALLLATGCSALGWVTLGFANTLPALVAGELFLAMSLSLTSGTDAAILYESLVELEREPEFGRWFGRNRAIGAASEGTAALAAGLLFTIWPPLPFFLQAGAWGLNALIAWQIIEPLRQPIREIPAFARARAIFHYAAVRSPRLRASMGLVLVLGMATFVPVWLIAIYADNAGVTVAWIGPLWALANYTVALGLWSSDRFGAALGIGGTLLLCVGLIAAGFGGLGLSEGLFGFGFYYLICLARGLNGPILSHVQQRLIPSSDRASLLSINSLLFRASFFALAPAIGLGVDQHGEHAVLLICGLAATPLCLAALFWLLRTGGHGDLEDLHESEIH